MTRGENLTVAEAVAAEKKLSTELGPHVGEWVAVRNHIAIAFDISLDALRNSEKVDVAKDTIFRVLPDGDTAFFF